jgi:uncharacterized repeat protein (TIGR01451 family)
MKKMKKYMRSLPFAIVCLLVLSSAATFAQRRFMMLRAARPEMKVVLSASVERSNTLVPIEKASIVKSGEILDWTITSTNNGNAVAYDYKTLGDIPAGTEFVAGSATADGSTTVTYSIDHGKSFSAQPLIEQRQADGSVKKVPAPVSMYTQVRYEWADPLGENGKLVAAYKVRLR